MKRTLTGGSSSTIKSHNRRVILLTLLRYEKMSRVQLAHITGLSSTTITNLVTELLEEGVVMEDGIGMAPPGKRRSVGRPQTTLRIVPQARYSIGIHVDVDTVRVTISDLLANPVMSLANKLILGVKAEITLAQIKDMVQQLVSDSRIKEKHIIGLGMGVPGLVNPDTGVNVLAPNQDWHNVPIRDWLVKNLPYPVVVDNGVRAMALGEVMFGEGQEAYTLAFVYARIGVGAGFVVDQQIYRGSGAGAGEIGHTTIIPDNGLQCRCGNSGCLETLVSEPAILKQARQLNCDAIGIEDVFAVARAGHHEIIAMLNDRARYMGIALANLINIINPEQIVLGGLFAKGHDLLLPTVEATMRDRAFADLGERVQLRIATYGEQAGVIGAAALALNTFFYQPSEYDEYQGVL